MQDNTKNGFVLPTGIWLTQERQRIGKTPADVAKAVQRHVRTVRALEQNNRVIPPGWCQDLRKLGINVPAPAWPAPLRPYYGADLHSDLHTRVGFRHSRYWLSKQLCVTEAAVTDVIQRNRIVPSSWLLKLAELGANVPAMVRLALYLGKSADATALTPIQTSPAASAQRERESMYISWTEERGFHFSISAALLEQVPAVFRELLTLLTQAGQQSAKPGQSAPAARL